MIPTRRLVALAALAALAGLGVAAIPALSTAWLALAALAVLVAAGDALHARRLPLPAFRRRVAGSLSLGVWSRVSLAFESAPGAPGLRFEAYDHHPGVFVARGLPAEARLPAGRRLTLDYRVRPTERGEFEFPLCELRLRSALGLWQRRCRLGTASRVRVYPNFSTVTKYALFGVEDQLGHAGLRLRRRRGEGLEFHQLRDYREGDPLRAIDWKATARMTRLIAKEYQEERDQQVLVFLDTGRRMLAKDGELSHFDHALNAMLLLGYVALRQGDAVGFLAQGGMRRWMPPRKGVGTVNVLLNRVYDLEPAPVEMDYLAGATELAVRQRRRALIVMLTNVRDEDTDDLRAAVELLRRKHLVMVASLRERVLDEMLEHPVEQLEDALACAATHAFLESRRRVHETLLAKGVLLEDTAGADLPAAITRRYLAVKRAGLL